MSNRPVQLWYENDNGEKWVPPEGGECPPPGYRTQVSRFLRDITTTHIIGSDLDVYSECKHRLVKETYGWIDGVEGRQCLECGARQSRESGLGRGAGWLRLVADRVSMATKVAHDVAARVGDLFGVGKRWPKEWEKPADTALRVTSSYPADIVEALVRSGCPLEESIEHVVDLCERCTNALTYELGLVGGYSKDSDEFKKCPSSCSNCRKGDF
jgi:hypothetical protein